MQTIPEKGRGKKISTTILLVVEISIIVLPKADKKILRKENHKNDYPS